MKEGYKRDRYLEGYEKRKRKAGKYQGYVDLSWTGDYLKGFQVLYLYQKIILEGKDIILNRGSNLSDHLKEFYGNEIEGLTKANLNTIASVIKNTLIKLYRNELFKM